MLLARPQYLALGPLRLAVRSHLPGPRFAHRPTGGTDRARYCYAVWMRHLALACRCAGLAFPRAVAELGPGDSIGIGLAALLSGVERYYAFDVVAHTDLARNASILAELAALYRARAPVPDTAEFPNLKPDLADSRFPSDLLPDAQVDAALARLERIKAALRGGGPGQIITYVAPWFDLDLVQPGSIDLVYSQAVMEHVDDLHGAYAALYRWLRPGGLMSHQIDCKCHGTARDWNGHWTYSDFVWRLIRGNQPYLINREPHSTHRRLVLDTGFRILREERFPLPSRLDRRQLAKRFRGLSADDLGTSGVFIQARRPDPSGD